MAGGMDLGSGGGGKKKALDAALNLVPLIDLMAVTIVFLIMTAVWTQLGRLEVTQTVQAVPEPVTPSVPVALALGERSFSLRVGGAVVANVSAQRDARGRLQLGELSAKLAEVKKQVTDQSAITLQAPDGLSYDDLVRVIDACVGSEFPSVSVEPLAAGG